MLGLLRLVRIQNLIILAFTLFAVRYGILEALWIHGIGLLLEQGFYPQGMRLHMEFVPFLLLVGSVILIAAGGYVINDYFDTKTDRINKPDKVFVGRIISRRRAILLHIALSTLGILLAFIPAWQYHNLKLMIIPVLSSLLLWGYSAKFKKMPLSGNLIIALLAGLSPILVALYEFAAGVNLSLQIMNVNAAGSGSRLLSLGMVIISLYAVFSFLITLIREIIKDIEDMDGDEADGGQTLPIVMGENLSKFIALGLIICCIVITGVLMRYLWQVNMSILFWYVAAGLMLPWIFLGILLWNAQDKQAYARASLVCKLIMISGLISMFVFKWSF
jgi:4-hydroxybenzoate polyprenyltransferase